MFQNSRLSASALFLSAILCAVDLGLPLPQATATDASTLITVASCSGTVIPVARRLALVYVRAARSNAKI